jgi:hypothetical protein
MAWRENDDGAVIAELGISLVFLLLMLGAAADLGRAVNTYLVASRISYESGRLLSRSPGLPNNQATFVCPGTYAAGTIQEKVCAVVETHGLESATIDMEVRQNKVPIQVEYLITELGQTRTLGRWTDNIDVNIARVGVRIPFAADIPFGPSAVLQTVEARYSGPYLVRMP